MGGVHQESVNTSEIKILIVDDHVVVRQGIKYMLEFSNVLNAIVHEAGSGEEAIEHIKILEYDIVIMDIKMPGMNGIDATREIIKYNPDERILGMSMHNEYEHVSQMIEAGASGYVLKNSGAEEIVKAIKTLLKGGKYYCNEVSQQLIAPYHDDIVKRKVAAKNVQSKEKSLLSKRETEILKLIANEYTNEEISETLNISKRTVDSHRQNIINKLRAKNTAGLIKYALKNDLV